MAKKSKPNNEVEDDPIVGIYTYTIKFTRRRQSTELERINDGLDVFHLLGILELTQRELMEQIAGSIKPDYIKRIVTTASGKKDFKTKIEVVKEKTT